MDVKQVQELIASDAGRQRKLAEQVEYAGGRNVAILGRRAHEQPDNRIPIPIARKGISLVTGYMGKAGNISYSTVDKYASDVIQPIFDVNDEQLTTQEELGTALTHGESWEYHFTDGNEARFVEVPVSQCIPLWSDDLPRKLIGMVRYYKTENGKKCEAYHFDASTFQKYAGDDFNKLDVDGTPVPHGYGEVPFAQLKISRDCSNLFDCVIQLIDFHDRIISEDYANESERFANSYLLLRNRLSSELDDLGMNEADKLKITRMFEDLGDDVTKAVAFLTKNIPIDFIKNAADTFERLIYDMMQIINPNEIATTGQISGIALAYKLLQFEYNCASMEAYFSRGLQWRIRLIQNVTGNMSANPMDRPQVTVQFRRNLPFDMQSAVDQFVKVYGILPARVALKLFPADFIPDTEEVAKEMEAGKEAVSMDTPVEDTDTDAE
jgi:SPP1 family phage portal protein